MAKKEEFPSHIFGDVVNISQEKFSTYVFAENSLAKIFFRYIDLTYPTIGTYRVGSKRAKNHYFGIFGQENLFFQKLLDSCASERD